MIRTLKGYPKYGIDKNNKIVSFRRGEWRELSTKSGVLCLHGERTISCTVSKFKYCVEKGIAPQELNGVSALVTHDGVLVTKSYFNKRLNEERKRKLTTLTKEERIAKLQSTIDMASACIDYINGNPEKLLLIIKTERARIKNSLYCNSMLAEFALDKAELELFDAVLTGNVKDPCRWLYKRAKGIVVDERRHIQPFRNID